MLISLIKQALGFSALFGLSLFLPAGTFAWPAAWIFLVMFLGLFVGVHGWLLKHNPALLEERLHLSRTDQKSWDKVLFPLVLVSIFAWVAFMSFDAARFHWSSMPVWMQGVGVIVLLISFYLLFLTFRENPYLSTVVRMQDERGQKVVSSGPYRYVRHPMYLAVLLFMAGAALLLGSFYGLLAMLAPMLVFVRRAVLEEQMLHKELPGYTEYTQRVKYRLIPFIW